MGGILCEVCHAEPKKYKCPTCSIPYCSLVCFKLHKPTHSAIASVPTKPAAPEIPQAPLPPPPPKYLRQKTDFSVLATNPKFQELLKTYPTLLSSLQQVYAATIQPERSNKPSFNYRGRGGRPVDQGRWTQKQGDANAMKILKGFREGARGGKEQGAMVEFVALVEDVFGPREKEMGDEITTH
ncbi:hypothetical protein K504DRAFT_381595 [Pleomassaria siparia CBS 279.74]|uniref:HIT-type domain-containing protein n=1 Tax=Pleomassaria siparia CBS 279.74 TaxID=1314801 RepID=A0A6G1K809_9PLEO|nr:hypothetical protein K504DRAFT_381595 [Pleomassaria siparia CBS 279.74]